MKIKKDSWVANPKCRDAGEHEEYLILRRDDLCLIGEVHDAEADCSFEDYALVMAPDGAYYLLCTSGCSCPDPDEEWTVKFGPASLPQMRKYLADEAGEHGYGVTKRQAAEFHALCDLA